MKKDVNKKNVKKNIRYGTFHLLIINEDKYIDGACISVYTYRKYGNKSVEHNCMIDKSISEQGIIKLKKYFDNVLLVPLINLESNFQLKTNKLKERYGKWANYAFTKWYILMFDSYEKVLLCDIDTLAVSDYTKIFDIKTPAWCVFHKNALDDNKYQKIIGESKSGDIMDKKYIENYTNEKLTDICNRKIKNKYFFIPVNGSMVLLKPSKKIFKELLDFVKSKNTLRRLSSFSFPDENILFEFYICHKKQKVYQIGSENLTTGWRYLDKQLAFPRKPIILNFDSTDKPWLKNKKDLYEEEMLWYDLRKKIKL